MSRESKVIVSHRELEASMKVRDPDPKRQDIKDKEKQNTLCIDVHPGALHSPPRQAPLGRTVHRLQGVRDNPWPSERHLVFRGIAAVSFKMPSVCPHERM